MTARPRLHQLVVIGLVGACTAAPPAAPTDQAAPAPGTAPPGQAQSPTAAAVSAAASAAPAATATGATATPTPLLRLATVERVVTAAVHSLALDPERGKLAALGTEPWLFDGKAWTPIPLPQQLRAAAGEQDQARIYFGRDHQPRIMGARRGAAGARQLYLRYRHGAWRAEQREQASFAGKPHAALFGVLGWEDPEVMCKVGEFCLIKQRSGWSQVPLPVKAPKTALRIDLAAGGVYALLERQLLRLRPDGWQPVGEEGPWQGTPGGAWLHAGGGWVAAPTENAIYEYDGTRWRRHASPVAQPRGLWAAQASELWVAGQDGAGFYDGRSWYRVADVTGPLSEVIGRDNHLWFGGAGGVWSAQRQR